MYKARPLQPKLAEHVIADDVEQWYECVVPLDEGYSPRFTFENGQHDIRGAYSRIFNCIGIHSLNHCGIKGNCAAKNNSAS